jgi:uncharacterized membrane protein YdbT with pleckstrin-like domain
MTERLLEGERLVCEVRRHWSVWFMPALIPLALAGMVVTGLIAVPLERLDAIRPFLALGAVIAAALWLWALRLRWRSVIFVLTDRRVIMQAGVLSHFSRSVRLDRVQNVASQEGVLGRVLGYGDVVLESAGKDGHERFDRIAHPRDFRDRIFEEMDRFAGRDRLVM